MADETGPIPKFRDAESIDDPSSSHRGLATRFYVFGGGEYTPTSESADTLRWEFAESEAIEAFGITDLEVEVLTTPPPEPLPDEPVWVDISFKDMECTSLFPDRGTVTPGTRLGAWVSETDNGDEYIVVDGFPTANLGSVETTSHLRCDLKLRAGIQGIRGSFGVWKLGSNGPETNTLADSVCIGVRVVVSVVDGS